jgi:hypothetical protein
MKKFTSVIRLSIAAVTALLALLLTSCGIAAEAIEESVKEANKQCPIYIDEYTTCERIYTSGNNVIYDYRTDPEVLELLPSVGVEECKYIILSEIAQTKRTSEDLRHVIELCVEAKYNMVYDYNDGMGKSFVVTITYNDLEKL